MNKELKEAFERLAKLQKPSKKSVAFPKKEIDYIKSRRKEDFRYGNPRRD